MKVFSYFIKDGDINDDDLDNISEVLAINKTIQNLTITLDWNPIDDEGANVLAEGIKRNNCLKKLNLSIKSTFILAKYLHSFLAFYITDFGRNILQRAILGN